MQPAVFLLAALGCPLGGGEGESRVVGEGDPREGNVNFYLVREAVDVGPVAVVLRFEELRFLGGLAAAAVPVVEGVLEQLVPTTQVGRPSEVPRGFASVPVGTEDVD